MSLDEQINKDYIQAMKTRDPLKSGTLNFLRAAIKQVKVDSRLEKMTDMDVSAIIKKQIKQRQDAIEQFEKGGRLELAEKEKAEMDIMKTYLPAEMPIEEVRNIVIQSIKEAGASSMKDMGNVMKIVRDKTAGRADGKIISDIVKEQLTA